MALNRSTLENYVLLMDYVLKMRNTDFKTKTFLKKIRPFCATTYLSDKIFFCRVRGSKTGICVKRDNNSFTVTQTGNVHEFIFYTDSTKLFLQKLLKHNLLIP
ncbi:hypothetical protein [Flavobacterium daejeonense]|uniref:hypothetical protein n=1 Tax=Flavobacterium daejeonense TaxID=350893 RepID=UPI000479ED82|nr:hypothetical protein [Flavobacterium daejeonense]